MESFVNYTQRDLNHFSEQVREGEEQVDRLRELIRQLRRDKHPTDTTERILQVFETVLIRNKQKVALIAQQLGK